MHEALTLGKEPHAAGGSSEGERTSTAISGAARSKRIHVTKARLARMRGQFDELRALED